MKAWNLAPQLDATSRYFLRHLRSRSSYPCSQMRFEQRTWTVEYTLKTHSDLWAAGEEQKTAECGRKTPCGRGGTVVPICSNPREAADRYSRKLSASIRTLRQRSSCAARETR
eukprot:CAMPEP_0177758554 /NCGR_PEP_ID=MMETSP0491_2-20121128/4249_1 /TAXON_ID=63592 /ORGANISM="Tetraselmis chuii, Strain PLY429" /LENGTH=112 /DNA_ID=CAMNT_0019274301 /DNA_START=460 /DNA_END=798 /DNA_ORIENTATION=-